MLFVAIVMMASGYTLLYAGVKGDSYKVGDVPVWRRPWLPFIDIFSGHALTGGHGATTTHDNPGAALASAISSVPSSGSPLAGQPTGGLGPTVAVPPPSSAPMPGGNFLTPPSGLPPGAYQ
jgi:hypothetical protein